MRLRIVLAILLLAGCARHEPPPHFTSGPELPVQAAYVSAIAASPTSATTTLVAWSEWGEHGRVLSATFDHGKGAWSATRSIDSLDGDAPLLLNGRDGCVVILSRSLRTFHQDPDGRWVERPGLTVPRSGLVAALAATPLPDGDFGIAFDLDVPDSSRNAEVWYQVCDSVFHPLQSVRVRAGTRPEPSAGIAVGLLEDGRTWVVSSLDGTKRGVRIDVRETDGSWTERSTGRVPWSGRPSTTEAEARKIVAAAALQNGTLVQNAYGEDVISGIPRSEFVRPSAVARCGQFIATAWIETREPTAAEGATPGGLRPRRSLSLELDGSRDSVVVDDVSCMVMTSGEKACHLWYGTDLGAERSRIGLRTASTR